MQGDEKARLDCILGFHWQTTIKSGKAYDHNRAFGRWTVDPTWNQVFSHLGPELMDEASEEYLRERLSVLCLDMARDDLVNNERDEEERAEPSDGGEDKDVDGEDDERVGRVYEAEVTIESFNDVKVQFAALGFIEKGTKRRPGSDTSTYWLLTERGHQQLLRLRAIRRAPKPEVIEAKNTHEPS